MHLTLVNCLKLNLIIVAFIAHPLTRLTNICRPLTKSYNAKSRSGSSYMLLERLFYVTWLNLIGLIYHRDKYKAFRITLYNLGVIILKYLKK